MKRKTQFLGGMMLSAAMLCSSVTAGVVVSLTGPEQGNTGLGGIPTQQIEAVEFDTTGITAGTAIVSLTASQVLNVTAWLTNATGPGTTAANVLATNVFASAVGDQQYTALSGINVGAGTYYLVLEAVTENNLVGWDYTTSPVITGSLDDGSLDAQESSPFVFGPSASFSGGEVGNLFEVTSNSSVAPEPATYVLIGAGLVAVLLLRVARRRALGNS